MYGRFLTNLASIKSHFQSKKILYEGDVLIFLGTVNGKVDLTCPDGKRLRHHKFLTRFGAFGRNVTASLEDVLEEIA